MTLTLDQFRAALRNSAERAELGIAMTDSEAQAVLADEHQVAAYFEIWEQDRGRREVNGSYWQPTAIAGFVLAIVGAAAIAYSFLPFAWTVTPGLAAIATVAAVILSANGLSACAANGTRGRALAAGGVVIGSASVLAGIAIVISLVST